MSLSKLEKMMKSNCAKARGKINELIPYNEVRKDRRIDFSLEEENYIISDLLDGFKEAKRNCKIFNSNYQHQVFTEDDILDDPHTLCVFLNSSKKVNEKLKQIEKREIYKFRIKEIRKQEENSFCS